MRIQFAYLMLGAMLASTSLVEAQRGMAYQWPTGSYQETKNGVSVNISILDKNETAALFDAYGKKLIQGRNSTIPCKIEIANNSDTLLILKESDITLPLATVNLATSWNIGSKVKTVLSTVAGIGARIVLIPVIAASIAASGFLLSTATIGITSSYFLPGWLAFSSIVYVGGYELASSRHQPVEQRNVQGKTEQITIHPKETKKLILFTSAKTLQPFRLSLTNLAGYQTTFAVNFDGTDTPPVKEITWMGVRTA